MAENTKNWLHYMLIFGIPWSITIGGIWLISTTSEKPPLWVYFILIFSFFAPFIFLYINKAAQNVETLALFVKSNGFADLDELEQNERNAIQQSVGHSFEVSNLYYKDTEKGRISVMDIDYLVNRGSSFSTDSHGHTRRSQNVVTLFERVFILPSPIKTQEMFSIGKKAWSFDIFEWIGRLFRQIQIIKTNDKEFDSLYSLISNNEYYVDYALKLFQILERNLSSMKKVVVGESSYICIVSFLSGFCVIRSNPAWNNDMNPFYNLALDLLKMIDSN